jgi:hypothetical protein
LLCSLSPLLSAGNDPEKVCSISLGLRVKGTWSGKRGAAAGLGCTGDINENQMEMAVSSRLLDSESVKGVYQISERKELNFK